MELNKVLERVRKLINLAETPGTPEDEAASAREKADQLMLDYAIEQADLDATRPAEQRATPESLKIDLIRSNSPVRGDIVDIAGYIANHCRCRMVVHNYFTETDDSSFYEHYKVGVTAVGYASDLRYFELMLTVVQLHFSGAVDPRPDPALSFDENCYRMHDAGVTYRKMVKMLFKDEVDGWTAEKDIRRLGARCKAGYKRECKKRGEEPRAIPNPDIYQRSFGKAYATRIFWRLEALKGSQSGGHSVSLVRRMETVDEKFNKMFPPENMTPLEKDEEVKADAAGAIAGYQAASEVELTGQRMGTGDANRPALG